jgi:hypothetical protein
MWEPATVTELQSGMDSECLALPLPVLSTLGGGGGRGKATEEAIRPTYFGWWVEFRRCFVFCGWGNIYGFL